MEAKRLLTIKGLIAFIYDVSVVPIAWSLAYWLRFNLSDIPAVYLQQCLVTLPAIMVTQVLFFKFFGLHRGVWHFASVPDLVRILKASSIGITCAIILFYISLHDLSLFHGTSIPLTIPILYGLILIGLLSVARLTLRICKNYHWLFKNYKVIIVGAGKAGEGLVRELLRYEGHSYKPIAFVDDDLNKLGSEIQGIRVEGITADLKEFN